MLVSPKPLFQQSKIQLREGRLSLGMPHQRGHGKPLVLECLNGAIFVSGEWTQLHCESIRMDSPVVKAVDLSVELRSQSAFESNDVSRPRMTVDSSSVTAKEVIHHLKSAAHSNDGELSLNRPLEQRKLAGIALSSHRRVSWIAGCQSIPACEHEPAQRKFVTQQRNALGRDIGQWKRKEIQRGGYPVPLLINAITSLAVRLDGVNPLGQP